MARKQKEEMDISPFILPLTGDELKDMFQKYTDGVKGFKIYQNGNLKITAEYKYLNDIKVLTWQDQYNQMAIYYDVNITKDDNKKKMITGYKHWAQFEEYANKRMYAMQKELDNLQSQSY